MLSSIVKLRGDPRGNHKAWHRAISVAVGHKVYAFGGYPGNARRAEDQIVVSVFNLVSMRWTTLPPVTTARGERPPEVPCSCRGHTAVLIGDTVYIWGGENKHGLCNNMLYGFDVDTHRWTNTEVSGSVPESRSYHSACVLRKDMYVHGGHSQHQFNNDIYKLDTTTMVWSLTHTRGTLPPALSYHSASIMGTKMFVFGGCGLQEDGYNNLKVFDTETDTWLSTPSAQTLTELRWAHSAFVYNGELYIFGGENVNQANVKCQITDDLWKFSPQTSSWKEVKLKVTDPFRVTGGCCCMVGDRVFMFGGYKDNKRKDGLYVLDFSPSLKMICKRSVIQYRLNQSQLPHDIRWELAAMTKMNLPRQGSRK